MVTKTVFEEDEFLVYNQFDYDYGGEDEHISFKSLIDAKTYCDLF
jgi:hypothetical protein